MEDIFNNSASKYNEKLDKFDLLRINKKDRIVNIIRRNKFISLVLISLFILSIINFYLIYSFIRILESI